MSDQENIKRYERKFIVNKFFINSLGDLISFLKINLKEQYKERRVNSIYYDTHDYKLGKKTIDGLSDRTKIRIRYYGKLKDIIYPRLEIKNKTGLVGEKLIYEIDNKSLYEKKFSLANLKINNLNIDYFELIKNIEPKVIISYTRNYFISSCNKYRFTLDKEIIFRSFEKNNIENNFSNNSYYRFNKSIIEFKYNISNENTASRLTQNLPFRLTSSSKYLTALKHLGLVIV